MEKFDVIVVGAGAAGNAATYTLAKAGLNVLQIERGETSGTKNVQGAILYADALERIIPDFRDDAPLERHIVEQRIWIMEDKSHVGTHYRSDTFNEDKPNRYTILRAQFDKWFSGKVRESGALVINETTVLELLKDASGKVCGVRTDRVGGDIYADAVILADGVNSLLARKAGLREEIQAKNVALAVKEVHFLPQDVLETRFNIEEEEGVVIEIAGTITRGLAGTAFLYTNRESVAIGIGCMLEDFKGSGVSPYTLLEDLKNHPSIKPLIAGGEVKEYAAHLIPEGGYKALPKLAGDGWLMVGDSAGFVNAVHREGSNLAMTSGRLAAETVIALKAAGKPATAANLQAYVDALNDSFVMKDLRKYQHVPALLEEKQFLTTYPTLLNRAAEVMLRVDGVDKKTKQRSALGAFVQNRSLLGLMKDTYKLWRAFR